MTHKYNTQVFLAGSETSKKLLDLYCSLVIIELAVKDSLKDKTKTWPQIGHDITTGIQNFSLYLERLARHNYKCS